MATPVKVTFNFEWANGTFWVDDTPKQDTEKSLVYELDPGTHTFSYENYPHGNLAPNLSNVEFTVGNEDLEINPFEYVGCKNVDIIATGDLLNEDLDLSYYFIPQGFNSDFADYYFPWVTFKSEMDKFIGHAYLFPGEYKCDFSCSEISFVSKSFFSKFIVRDNEECPVVNLSFNRKDWHKVLVNIVDENGNKIEDNIDSGSSVTNQAYFVVKDNYMDLGSGMVKKSQGFFYAQDGDYLISVYRIFDDFKHFDKISVSGNDLEVLYKYSDELKQNLNVKIINADSNKNYVISFDIENSNLYKDLKEYKLELTTDINGNASGTISLTEGIYYYSVLDPESACKGKIEVKDGSDCLIDLSGYKEYTINLVDENGDLIVDEYGCEMILYKDNYPVLNLYTEKGTSITCLLKENETYEVWSFVGLNYKTGLQTFIVGGENKLDIELNELENRYVINFMIGYYPFTTFDILLTGKVFLDGTDITPGLFYRSNACLLNVPEGKYNYTIDSNEYGTLRGTVIVGPETASSDGVVDVYIEDIILGMATGITNAAVKNDAFSVYPSVVDDYIYISNKDKGQSAWNVTLYSASGTVVCRDRILSDSDTASVYVGNLGSGFYLMVIENETGRCTYKMMKK